MIHSPSVTKARILDIAEELFGDRGLERVSIRDITEAADVNLAAVNYHFGGKEELIEAVFERRLAPLNEARLMALDTAERAAAPEAPAVESILEALIEPALESCGNGSAFAKLLGRCLAETRPEVETFLRQQFAPLATRFEAAFMKALPHLSREDVFWCMKFTFGALHHWLLTREKFIPPDLKAITIQAQTQKLITFAAAGFRAR